jgi:hypothetical protein
MEFYKVFFLNKKIVSIFNEYYLFSIIVFMFMLLLCVCFCVFLLKFVCE